MLREPSRLLSFLSFPIEPSLHILWNRNLGVPHKGSAQLCSVSVFQGRNSDIPGCACQLSIYFFLDISCPNLLLEVLTT